MQVTHANPQAAAESYAMLNRAVGVPVTGQPEGAVTEPAEAGASRSLFSRVFAGVFEAAQPTEAELAQQAEAQKHEQELRDAAEQLVATTFIMPLFSQLRNDPMASEMFHGGRGEKVFQQQLDQILSDRISTGAGFDLVDTVADYFAGRRGGAAQARSALDSAAAPVVGGLPEVDLHG